ncbi:T9SS type B sorting domain-containing protein [Flavobacterium sp. GSP14]|uniref:T9SS type B sorting domain-containing protein n=1 Tax=Flavobacterium sp. GSP14 TaxID=3401734 RepID=UPI003AAB1018
MDNTLLPVLVLNDCRIKKRNLIKFGFFIGIIMFQMTSYGQNIVPFTKRYNQQVKGDMLVIGNNTLGKSNAPLNDNSVNENTVMQFIDIDTDTNTFSSSSATLAVPPATTCFRIAYAGLYWGALIKGSDSRATITNVKLKLPGSTTYTPITGIPIYDTPAANAIVPNANRPYACYADVTALLSTLTNPQGVYTVADVSSSLGSNGTTGLAAGWTLVVVYEDPTTTTKSITTFDGFSALFDDGQLDIPVSGFITPPSGPVNVKFGFATLNGDKTSKNKFEVGNGGSNGTSIITTERPSLNFFNSSITDQNGYLAGRTPNSTNTLGYDTGIVEEKNATKIGNNATNAVISLQVPRGQANTLFSFFNSFLINVVAPDISLTKVVEDAAGKDVGNTTVNLGQDLYYKIDFQNIGNDQITAFTLEDVLPNNVIFNYPSDIITLPVGVTHTYNAATRRLVFTIPDGIVKIGDPINTIRLHVKVISDYNQLSTACSNEIKNQAFANYRGIVNATPVVGEGSFASVSCNFGSPTSTNFLVDINGRTFKRTQVLCGATAILSASNGYNSYSWSTSPTGTPVISTSQTYTATSTGTYYVSSTSTTGCTSIKEEINLIPFGNTITNPVSPYADVVPKCPNNGKDLPNIFLCGATATRLIQTNITDASSIEWQKLNETTCPSTAIANCANENFADSCWNTIATGQNYSADTAGQFRVVLKYPGGCQSIFYFNVYKNTLNPTVDTNDIICTTKGTITVGGVPSGYEYSLDKVTYQASNIFTINTAGTYTVYIRQVGVTTNPCIFEVKNILIRLRNFTVQKIRTQPLCNGNLGAIRLVADDVRSQYYFSISKGGTPVNSVGPILTNEATFSNLAAGTYAYEVRTDDGCIEKGSIDIIDPAKLTATSALTKPLTCANGEITVYPVGGTPPYKYFVNSTTVSQTVPQIVVSKPLPAGGVYNITVVDANNCSTPTSITVSEIPKPVYTVTQTDVKCYGDKVGVINFNVTNANGYTLAYSIDNGTTYLPTATFSNLAAGTYNTILKYSLNGVDCFDTMKIITIAQPLEAVTASAGVSELAGCGPSGEGRVRITNPQGGVAPYEFSFDNQASWTTVNNALKLPGTYILYVRDINKCIFQASVTVDPEPASPIINVDTPVDFNCDGTATSTVTINNPGGVTYTYDYYMDGIKNTNTPSNVFLNVLPGTHKVTVEYKLNSVTTFSNLLFEDFGKGGYTTTPGINPAYCFEDETTPHPVGFPCGNFNDYQINDGKYAVASSIKTTFGVWIKAKDHTLPTDPLGRFLCVNVGGTAGVGGVLYSKAIKNVIPNQDVKVSIWAENLIKKTSPGLGDPDLTIQLWKDYGLPTAVQVGVSVNTGSIPKSEKWENYVLSINPGNNTDLTFLVRSNSTVINGNDVLIDDINVFQLPKSCITTKDFTVIVPTGKAFTAQITGSKNVTCFGLTNGEITIAAQNFDASKGFQYSKDNGANWVTTTTSPVTLTGLAAATYAVLVRPNPTSAAGCTKTFSQPITAPTAVTSSASIILQATCSTGATIRAVGGGGTPAYQYELRAANGTTVVTAFNNNRDFTNVPAGDYTVFVRDANGCTNPTGIAIKVNAPPSVTATLDASTDYCYTGANPATLVVNVSGGVGPFTYKLDSSGSISSALTTLSFANVTPGTHTILVTDSNNCTSTISNIVIAPAVAFNLSLLQDLTCLVDASIGNEVITGGYGTPYTYTVSYNSGTATAVTSFPYTATVPGTYVFTVSDAKGCPATSNTITVTPKTTPTHTTVKTDITCNGLNNGTITVTPSGGFTTSYTYAIKLSTATTFTTQTTNQFTSLAAGTYDINVIDSKGCSSVIVQVTIVNPTALVVSASATTFTCSTTNTKQSATVTIDLPTTGTSPYKYSFNGGSFTNTNTLVVNDNGSDQTVNYAVRDGSNCVTTGSITLNRLNPPTIATITNTPIYCVPASSTTSDVTVPVTAGTGVGTITYTITSPAAAATNTTGATTGIFTGLTAGTYVFKVTDANGCFASKSHTVPALISIAVTATKLSDVDCFGNSTGSIRYNVSGFSTNYSYTINGGSPVTGQTASTFNLSGRPAGIYNVEFTDDTTGCIAPTSITINQPALALDITLISNTNANCNVPTARVTVAASGGTTAYAYAFVTTTFTPAIGDYTSSPVRNLNPSTPVWDVYVRDANGCTDFVTVTVTTDPTPTVTASGSGCLGTPGGYTITANNTTPVAGIINPITYSLNGGAFQTGNTFIITAAGDYTIRMRDGNGCIATAAVVTVNPQLTLTAVLNKDITCVIGDEPAKITVTPSGGSGSFTYAITTPALQTTNVTGATTGVFTTSVPGSYTFTVTDAATLCTYTTTTAILVTAKVDPDITAVTQTAFINCNGDDTGAIRADFNPSLGLAPFQFSNNGGPFQNSNTFTGLSAGTYTVIIKDAKGCTDFRDITIAEPPPMVIVFRVKDIQCVSGSGISKGSIIIDAITDGVSAVGGSGGTPPYTYYVTGINGYNQSEMNPGNISTTFDVVDFGFYQIRVVDAKGCTVIENNVKVASDPDDLDIVINTTADCTSGGTADVEVLGALTSSGPFHFNIYNGPGQVFIADGTGGWQGESPLGSKGTTFTGLFPGVTYTFIVYDSATLCYYYETAFTPIPSNSSLVVANLVPKNITCTGSNDGNVSFDITNSSLSAIGYTYEIFEAFTNVSQYLSGSFTVPASSTVNIPLIPITLGVGSYYVYVRETSGPNAGCGNASANFNILESPKLLTVKGTVIKNSNCTNDGIITAQAQYGTGPYTYQVVPTGTPAIATDWVGTGTFTRPGSLTGITYDVYAKDAYGCIKFDTVTALADAPPTISLPAPICYNGTPFTIDLVADASASATILPATYSVNSSAFQNSSSFTFNAAGTYNLVIRDGNGCTDDVDYIVYPQLQLTPTLTKPLDCTATPDAIITLTTTGGNTVPGPANYTYQVSFNGAPNVASTNPYTATAAGTYVFTITDANNATPCTTTATIILDPIPATVIATPVVTNVICNGESNGTISVTVTSGEGPYTYSLSGPTTNASGDASGVYTDLPIGNYTVTVRNAKGCLQASTLITITEPNALNATAVADVNSKCSNTTVITVTANGGTKTGTGSGYTYNFNGLGYSSDNTFTLNNTTSSASTTISVKDANGCTFDLVDVDTPELLPPTDLVFYIKIVPTCPAPTATVEVKATSGYGALNFTIIAIDGVATNTYPTQTAAGKGIPTNFAGLAPGDYMFQVTDANGCSYQKLQTVSSVTNITAAAKATTDVTCFGFANGTATFDIANFGGTYSYTFDGGTAVTGANSAQLTFSGLTPTTHTLVVTDQITGCSSTVNVTINQPAAALDFNSTATNTYCTTDMATIIVVASGGTLNYKYAAVIAGSTPLATDCGSSNTLVVDTNGGANMVWDVYVMDAKGCFITKPQTIAFDASPVITSVVATQCPSPTGTYTITVTATGFSTALQYSAGGGNFQTGNVITVNASGPYTISVKDANGCTTTAAAVTILDPLILTPTVTTSPSCTDGDGVIAVATTGGSGNYQYRIDSGVYPMTTPFIGIASGTHTIYVRDTTTGCEVNRTVTLQPATLITGFNLNTTPVTCNGGSDGTITATLATPAPGINDNPVYTYTLNGITVGGVAVSRLSQDSQLFSGLAAGTYTVEVTSSRACTATQTIDVLEPGVLVVLAPAIVQFGCTSGNTGNLATITVTGVTGGTTPYLNYEFIKVVGTTNTQVQFSASNVYTEGNLLGGSYLVNVYDSKGCVGTTTAPITIAPYVALDKVNVKVDQAITCSNLENITVTATTVGGPAPNLEYTLVDTNATTNTTGTFYPSQTNTTGVFTNLPVADYLITVRNLDTNCEIQGVHYVNEPNTFDLVVNATTDITCLNDTNGTATITFVDRLITTTPPNGDDAGAFTYTLQDALGNPVPGGSAVNAGPITITGLAAGTYTITAKLSQSPNCEVTKNFTIGAPSAALDITETHTEITCVAGNNDGSISVSATGGWSGGYVFEVLKDGAPFSAYSDVTNYTNLTAGVYTLNVKDSKGCRDTATVTLVNPTPISITATPATQLLTCFGDKTASIQATGVSGGQGTNYLYTINYVSFTPASSSGPQAAAVFNNLGAGSYSITVTDGWGCSATSATVVVNGPTEVKADLVLSRSQTCLTSSQLTLTAAGGTPPYTYSADYTTYSTTPFASSISINVPVGTYHYFVKDFNGCVSKVSNDIEILPLEKLVVNVDLTNAKIFCRGDFTGVIVAKATGGLGNYNYTLLNGSGVVIVPTPEQITPGRFTKLGVGFYQVRVVSGDCNEVSAVIEIKEPLLGVTYTVNKTDVTCNGQNNGRIDVSGTGGTGKIMYSISDRSDQFFDDGIFENLAPGSYKVIIQDENGCYEPFNFKIDEPPLLFGTLQPNSLMPEICAGDKDGAFSITVAGGVNPYSVSLDAIKGIYTQGVAGQTDFDFTNLSGGAHKVYIKDASNCTSELEVIMPNAVVINPTAVATYDCVNNTQANRVVVSYDASNDPADLDFALDGLGNYQASNTFDNVVPGQHFITVRHTNGCIQRTQNITVDQVDPLVLVIADGDLNQIKATATGGSGIYEYSFNGEDFTSQSTYAYYQSANYSVIVRDKNGCTANAKRDFTYIDICIPNYFTPNGDGNLDDWAPGCTNNYPDLSFSIFDRYGRLIAKYRIGQKWNGKYKGEELPSGDYWYTLKLNNNKDDREFVGHFTLYR